MGSLLLNVLLGLLRINERMDRIGLAGGRWIPQSLWGYCLSSHSKLYIMSISAINDLLCFCTRFDFL